MNNLCSDIITPEMKEWFYERTNNHIKLVMKYCDIIAKKHNNKAIGKMISTIGVLHDQSKFFDIELDPYIVLSWEYKSKQENFKFDKITDEMRKEIDRACLNHIKTNRHHPEYWCEEELLENNTNTSPMDVTTMEEVYLSEMVADWCAMSEELNNSPVDWAEETINKKWKFSPDQIDIISDTLFATWGEGLPHYIEGYYYDLKDVNREES